MPVNFNGDEQPGALQHTSATLGVALKKKKKNCTIGRQGSNILILVVADGFLLI